MSFFVEERVSCDLTFPSFFDTIVQASCLLPLRSVQLVDVWNFVETWSDQSVIIHELAVHVGISFMQNFLWLWLGLASWCALCHVDKINFAILRDVCKHCTIVRKTKSIDPSWAWNRQQAFTEWANASKRASSWIFIQIFVISWSDANRSIKRGRGHNSSWLRIKSNTNDRGFMKRFFGDAMGNPKVIVGVVSTHINITRTRCNNILVSFSVPNSVEVGHLLLVDSHLWQEFVFSVLFPNNGSSINRAT